MTEISRNSSKVVYLDVYGGSVDAPPTAVCSFNGQEFPLTVEQDTPPTGVDQRYKVTLSMAYTQSDGELSVRWTFSMDNVPVVKTDYFEVITPYLTINEIKGVVPGITTAKAQELEANVRHVINAYTGQSFGRSKKTVGVYGAGGRSIQLPERLISFEGVETSQYVYNPYAYQIVSDGFYLRQVSSSLQTVKEMPNEASLDHGPVIVTPYTSYYRGYREGALYRITGEWGYESVPAPVRTAALLLASDYGCNEVAYRDKFLESIKAADWRLQFGSQAWDGTGNLRADQLLSEYILLDWAVV